MNITINQNENRIDVAIDGRISTDTIQEFQAAIAPLLEAETPQITVDCSKLTYTSSQGLRSFLALQKSVSTHKGSLVLRDMQPHVREVFDITGFSSIIKIV